MIVKNKIQCKVKLSGSWPVRMVKPSSCRQFDCF